MAKSNTANLDFFEKVGFTFGLINESWEAFKLNWSTFLIIWFMPAILMFLLIPLFLLPALSDSSIITTATLLLAMAGMILAFVIIVILIPAMVIAQIAGVKQKKLTFNEAFKQSKGYVWRFILAAIISFFIVIGPLLIAIPLMFVLIGLFLLPFTFIWAFIAPFFLLLVPYVIVTEDVSATEAISRSYNLTKQNWQWILAVFIVLLAINFVTLVPLIGWIVGLGLTLAYFCMPAYIYVHQINNVKVSKTVKANKKKSTK